MTAAVNSVKAEFGSAARRRPSRRGLCRWTPEENTDDIFGQLAAPPVYRRRRPSPSALSLEMTLAAGCSDPRNLADDTTTFKPQTRQLHSIIINHAKVQLNLSEGVSLSSWWNIVVIRSSDKKLSRTHHRFCRPVVLEQVSCIGLLCCLWSSPFRYHTVFAA